MSRLCAALFPVFLASVLLLAAPAHAQHGGGGGGGHAGGMGPGGGMPGGGMGGPAGMRPGGIDTYGRDHGNGRPDREPESAGSAAGGMRSRTQLGLLGRWWDDKHVAKGLKLRPDQKTRMDSIFETSRPALVKSLQDYQQAQGHLEEMYRSKSLDENTLYSQIDKVNQARAELSKVYTHYMLQIRGEMDADQLTQLDEATRKQ